MDIDELRQLAVTIAPELEGALSLTIRADDWSRPNCRAFASRLTGRIVFIEEPTVPLLIHEVAHILPVCHKAETVQAMAAAMPIATEVQSVAEQDQFDLESEWKDHGVDFTRRVLHLAYRTRKQDIEFSLAECQVAGLDYGAPPLWRLEELLGDEPERLESLGFGSIETIPAPQEFLAAFHESRQFYESLRSVPRKIRS